MNAIDHFIKKLSEEKVSAETRNLYRGDSEEAQLRRRNLCRYLNKMLQLEPRVLLLGEAPGYKGCGITGVPFSSERELSENKFYTNQGFECINEPSKRKSEITGTIVWNELHNYSNKPLMWNIFPFHPHKANNSNTNRTPKQSELKIGKKYLKELLSIYPVTQIIALGRKPASQLKDLGYEHTYVRHPAQGGKLKFVNGLKLVLG